MTTMKTKLYTVLTAALLSTTVLSTAQGASVDAGEGEGASARNILSLLASLEEVRATMAAVVRSKMVLTNDNFVEKIAGMFSDTEVLDLSKVTMGPDQIKALNEQLNWLSCHREPTAPDDASSVGISSFGGYIDKIKGVHGEARLHTIIVSEVNTRTALSFLTAVNSMPSVKNVEFAIPPSIGLHDLKDILSFREDLMFGVTYQGPLLPLLEQVRKRSFPQLTTLNLWGHEIGDDGARALADALPHMTRLTTLNLEFNSIGFDGARALAAALPHVPELTTLNLEGNRIGNVGAVALAEALQHVPELKVLDLADNHIGDDGASALARALVSLSQLKTLELGGNRIGDYGAAALATALATALRHLPKLTTLNLHSNSISNASAEALSAAVAERLGFNLIL